MQIRLFRDDDAAGLSQLIQRALTEVNAKDYPEKAIGAKVAEYSPHNVREQARHKVVYVAEEDGALVGTASIEGDFISAMFVDPTLMGRGVGKQLLLAVEQAAQAVGIKKVALEATVTAHGFYRHLGYSDVSTDGRLTIMDKALD